MYFENESLVTPIYPQKDTDLITVFYLGHMKCL